MQSFSQKETRRANAQLKSMMVILSPTVNLEIIKTALLTANSSQNTSRSLKFLSAMRSHSQFILRTFKTRGQCPSQRSESLKMRTENLRGKLLLHQRQQSHPHGALGSQNQRKQARVLNPPPRWRNSLNLMPNRRENLPLRRPAHTP